MPPRKKWPEEADWCRQDVISLLEKVVMLLMVAMGKISDEEALRILGLIIALAKIGQEWLRAAKSETLPSAITAKLLEIMSRYI